MPLCFARCTRPATAIGPGSPSLRWQRSPGTAMALCSSTALGSGAASSRTPSSSAFKGLFDRITPVSDAQLAEAFMEGRRSWAGVHATPVALRNYTDVILQDLVEWCAHPIKGPDYLAATDRFPFLAAKGWQHADWLRFFSVNSAKAAVMRVADRQAALQEPQTPPGLRPVQQLLANPAAIIDLIQEVPGAPAAPSGGWTAADVYARYGEPLKAGVPSLKGSMVQQVGHSNC